MKAKIKIILVILVSMITVLVPATTLATSSSKSSVSISQAVAQSYSGSSSIKNGMIVQIKNKSTNSIEPLTKSTIANMLGVVVPASSATVALTPQNNNQQLFVASSGRYNVLVSDENGVIKSGDYITISPINGVAMKADQNESLVLGRAFIGFNGSSSVVGSVNATTTGGQKKHVLIGLIPVNISIEYNPLVNRSISYVPSFLAKTASTIAAKPVSAVRIYLGLLILFISTILTAILLYSGIKSGMISIGRNPLSKKTIIRSLLETVATGLIIFVIGIFAVYLLIKL